jgi:hypothetical protein
MSTETSFLVLSYVMIMMGVGATDTVTCLRRNYLARSGEVVNNNIEQVPGDGTKYQWRPLFFFGEVVSEFRTMDSISNMVRDGGGDFSLLNDNQHLLFWEVEAAGRGFVSVGREVCALLASASVRMLSSSCCENRGAHFSA